MKVHRKRIRLLKGLAIAGCAVGLAVPSVAGAMPADGPFRQAAPPVTTYPPHGRPADVAYAPPTSHNSDVPSTAASKPVSSPSPVVREIRTVTHEGSHTLAIVLAAAALGIALCGTGYALARLALIQRRVLGSR